MTMSGWRYVDRFGNQHHFDAERQTPLEWYLAMRQDALERPNTKYPPTPRQVFYSQGSRIETRGDMLAVVTGGELI